jgi:hypothetical protein
MLFETLAAMGTISAAGASEQTQAVIRAALIAVACKPPDFSQCDV